MSDSRNRDRETFALRLLSLNSNVLISSCYTDLHCKCYTDLHCKCYTDLHCKCYTDLHCKCYTDLHCKCYRALQRIEFNRTLSIVFSLQYCDINLDQATEEIIKCNILIFNKIEIQ